MIGRKNYYPLFTDWGTISMCANTEKYPKE